MNASPQPKVGLTYGRLLLVLVGLIALAVGVALWRQGRLAARPTFDEIPFELVRQAAYDRTEVDSAALARLRGAVARVQGALLFVHTGEGRYAKLAAEFARCLLDPQRLKFWIHRGVVYSAEGQQVRRLDNTCVDLSDRFDLDTGRTVRQGAPPEAADLGFLSRGVGDQTLLAVGGARLALPDPSTLKSSAPAGS